MESSYKIIPFTFSVEAKEFPVPDEVDGFHFKEIFNSFSNGGQVYILALYISRAEAERQGIIKTKKTIR